MFWFHSNFAKFHITIISRSYSILVIVHQILAESWPFFNSFCCSFLLSNFWRDALIQFRLCRTLYHCKIQVRFNIGNHLPKFGWVMTLFWLSFCWCVDIGFRSITFARLHWLYWKFAEGYIIVKYRSISILVIIHKSLGKLWPFIYLVACRDRSGYKDQCFFLFSYQMVGALSRWHIWFWEF